jgi:hypothetical protein
MIALAFAFVLMAAAVSAGNSEFKVFVSKSPGPGCGKLESVPADAALLFDAGDVAGLNWQDQAFHFTPAATARLLSNAADLEDESKEDFAPAGEFPRAEGHAFIMTLDGKIILSGIVAGMGMLQKPPQCALLYPALPMVDQGNLVVGVGLPRTEDELREDFFKVLIEEGPPSCFAPALPDEIKSLFKAR